jgi:16S rRNA (guanine527-N7)-methyltransferase
VLAEGIAEMGLAVSPAQQEKLMDYLALMFKWNSMYNLTSLRDPMQMVTHHLLDSLAAVPAFAGAQNVLDVGAGGGLPGIVLAVVAPGHESVDDRHRAQENRLPDPSEGAAGLANVTIYTMRVQELEVSDKFDVITSRAFADLSDFVNWSSHLLAEQGSYIALKGVAPQDEQQRLPAAWRVTKVEPLQVPRLGAERHLVFIKNQRNDATG